MKKIRNNVFETNSSSTHSLVIYEGNKKFANDYEEIRIRFIDMDNDKDCYGSFYTLEDKMSYLISHIAHQKKYIVSDYEELLEEIKDDYQFHKLERYAFSKFGKKIVFPNLSNAGTDVDTLVNINHQIAENDFGDVLNSLIMDSYETKFDIIFDDRRVIELDKD